MSHCTTPAGGGRTRCELFRLIAAFVSSGNFPHFDVNPNTGAPEGTGLTRNIARNTLFLDKRRASLVLPIMPTRG
jgi:predicted acyl esterase